jgi:putative MFS transporter
VDNFAANITGEGAHIIARLDRLPRWPYPPVVMALIGFCYLAAFFDSVNVGFALPAISKALHFSPHEKALPITAGLVGYVIGAWLASTLADLYGRKTGIAVATLLYSLGSVVACFAGGLDTLVAGRLISGLGGGAVLAVMSAYISEISPAAVRGRYTSYANVYALLGGNILVPIAALLLLPNFTWGWRAFFFLSAFGCLALLVLPWIPESPRWLLSKGRLSAAAEVVEAAEARLKALGVSELSAPIPVAGEDVVHKFPSMVLLKAPFFGRVVLLSLLWYFWYSGLYVWFGLGPTLLIDRGYTLTHSFLYLLISAVGYPAGSLLATVIGDHYERKNAIFLGLLLWMASFVVIGVSSWIVGGRIDAVFLSLLLFSIACAVGFTVPLMYTLSAESFPTRARATGLGVTNGLGHIGGAIAPIIAVFLYYGQGGVNRFIVVLLFIALNGLLAALVVPFGIKATRKSMNVVSR